MGSVGQNRTQRKEASIAFNKSIDVSSFAFRRDKFSAAATTKTWMPLRRASEPEASKASAPRGVHAIPALFQCDTTSCFHYYDHVLPSFTSLKYNRQHSQKKKSSPLPLRSTRRHLSTFCHIIPRTYNLVPARCMTFHLRDTKHCWITRH